MSMDGLRHTSSEGYITGVLEYVERLGYPALEVSATQIAAGRNGWGLLAAGADRGQLVRALGVVIATAHRAGKA